MRDPCHGSSLHKPDRCTRHMNAPAPTSQLTNQQTGRVRRPEECFTRLALWIDAEARRYASLVGASLRDMCISICVCSAPPVHACTQQTNPPTHPQQPPKRNNRAAALHDPAGSRGDQALPLPQRPRRRPVRPRPRRQRRCRREPLPREHQHGGGPAGDGAWGRGDGSGDGAACTCAPLWREAMGSFWCVCSLHPSHHTHHHHKRQTHNRSSSP